MDTLAYAKKLRAAGVPEQQAEAFAEALKDAAADSLATKADLLAMETRLMRFLYVQAIAIVGFVVALIKLLP